MTTKVSYTVPCSSAFRDAVEALAAARGGNVADLARSVVLLLPPEAIRACPDPGEPAPGDRDAIADGRRRRKPRLQVRLPAGYDAVTIRKALAVSLAIADGKASLDLDLPGVPGAPRSRARQAIEDEIARLLASIDALAFDPLPDGVETRADALYVLGYHPAARPTRDEIRRRFRVLATVHHPDGRHGSHRRMAQLNDAMALLRR